MKVLLVTMAMAGVLSIVFTACAPAQSPYTPQPSPGAPQFYGALTPEDAYRSGLIDRWQLEHLVGPSPQALQGPGVNSNRSGGVQ